MKSGTGGVARVIHHDILYSDGDGRLKALARASPGPSSDQCVRSPRTKMFDDVTAQVPSLCPLRTLCYVSFLSLALSPLYASLQIDV